MRVLVIGATGFIGSASVQELLGAGHQVVGLARSDKDTTSLRTVGAEVHYGSLEDTGGLRSGAAASDGVIHTAYTHNFFDRRSCQHERGWQTMDSTSNAQPVHYRTATVGGVDVFYREAGPVSAPVVLLLHGFPTSSACSGT